MYSNGIQLTISIIDLGKNESHIEQNWTELFLKKSSRFKLINYWLSKYLKLFIWETVPPWAVVELMLTIVDLRGLNVYPCGNVEGCSIGPTTAC